MADVKALRASREKHGAKKKDIQEELAKDRSKVLDIMKGGVTGSGILAHNGIVALVWGAAMLIVAYVALQAAFYFVAVIAGSTGAYAMETAADLLTIYVALAMVCGFDLFFAFKIENRLIRAMKRRFWHKAPDGTIDHGEAWAERRARAEARSSGSDMKGE